MDKAINIRLGFDYKVGERTAAILDCDAALSGWCDETLELLDDLGLLKGDEMDAAFDRAEEIINAHQALQCVMMKLVGVSVKDELTRQRLAEIETGKEVTI